MEGFSGVFVFAKLLVMKRFTSATVEHRHRRKFKQNSYKRDKPNIFGNQLVFMSILDSLYRFTISPKKLHTTEIANNKCKI